MDVKIFKEWKAVALIFQIRGRGEKYFPNFLEKQNPLKV